MASSRATIGSVNVVTGRAGAAGVPRDNHERGNTDRFSFAGYKKAKLEERPGISAKVSILVP